MLHKEEYHSLSLSLWLARPHRTAVRHRGVRLQGEPAGVPAGPPPSRHGVLLQPRPGARGEHVHQGPGVLRLPGGPGHGVPVF